MSISCLAILTYRRASILSTFLRSLSQHCSHYPVAVFEDCANFDETSALLTAGLECKGVDLELEAEVWQHPTLAFTAYLGTRNVGVASNSNRALKWFERQPESVDHLCLCNDDLEALGDFPAEYAKAHAELKIGLFCHCDVKALGEAYRGPEVRVLNTKVRLIPQGRQTGCMMSITRALFKRIGYYDTTLGRMGQEHVEFNNRATLAGFTDLRGKPQVCLDLAAPSLRMQLCRPSVSGTERQTLDAYANNAIHGIAARYQTEKWYRPYQLLHGARANAYGGVGIPAKLLKECGYAMVVDYQFNDAGATC